MDMDEVLIEEVRNHTILYDLGHSDYKNLKKKELEWREVEAILKLNEVECKKRWKGLRDSYKRCKRMEQVASGSGAGIPKKRWRYFDAMSFLDIFTSSRRTLGNIYSDVYEQEEYLETDLGDDLLSPASQCSTLSPPEKKKNDSDKFQEFLDLAASSISETCAAVVAQSQTQDSTATHFASLAAKIREANMPQNVVNKIEAEVSGLVFAGIETFYSTMYET